MLKLKTQTLLKILGATLVKRDSFKLDQLVPKYDCTYNSKCSLELKSKKLLIYLL